tara:strand:- start:3128 stop:3529 length:402 start_codon:yes stop_codon:yes gene_type:complete
MPTHNKKDKKTGLPKNYVPDTLTKADRKKQIDSIKKGKPRPKLESFKSKRSGYVARFEKKYGTKISNRKFIHDNIITYAGQDKILKKGMAAYYSSGSRPNQTATSWSLARLGSVILGGPARRVDKAIWEKYKR